MARNSRRIVVLGGGFAGLWSAVGAARKLDELRVGTDEVEVTLVNRDAFHSIRVRNYEADLGPVRVPLDDVLGPVGVRRVEGEVYAFDLAERVVDVRDAAANAPRTLAYDRLVFALGSEVVRRDGPGLSRQTFDVDTYGEAARLDAHLRSLPGMAEFPGRSTVVVVGAGLTGIEVACEMPGRLRAIFGADRPIRVILADREPRIGSDMGDGARAVIEEALGALGVETRPGVSIASVDGSGMTLASGEVIPTATVVWCAGMRASPLAGLFPVEHDRFGRIPVDADLKVRGVPDVFAAGDSALSMMDDTHASVMSCQHGRPMGRFAGHNVVCDLLGLPMLPLRIEGYVTILDLGPWGAVYTQGWDRAVIATGEAAKRTKQLINGQRIYPPRSGDRREILRAAAPVVQLPPETGHRPG